MGTQTKDRNEKVVTVEDKKYKFIMPTIGEVSDADTEYSKAYIKALKDGLPPRMTLEKQLKESGSWNEKDDNDLIKVSSEIQEAFVKLKSESDGEKKAKLKEDLLDIQNKLIQATVQKQMLFSHTAESKGEEAKITTLAWKCILSEDNSKLWKSKEDYLNQQSNSTISKLLQDFIMYISGYENSAKLVDEIINEKADVEEIVNPNPSPVPVPVTEEVKVETKEIPKSAE